MKIHIEKINAAATYPVRHATLRKGKPLSTCFFDGDVDPQTIHLGAFVGNQLVGVVSIYDKLAPQFPEKIQKQLRNYESNEKYESNRVVLPFNVALPKISPKHSALSENSHSILD